MKNQSKKYTPAITCILAIGISLATANADDDQQEQATTTIRGDNPNIGIKYDKKQGLLVTPFSAKLLGFKVVDVAEKEISSKITLQAQVFDISTRGTALASAWIPQEDVEKLEAGAPVESDAGFDGKIVRVASKLNRQSEVLIEFEDENNGLKIGKFLTATVVVNSNGEVVVVPKSAVVNSAEGAFAYVDNGGWTVRTGIEVGAEEGDMVEIIDGLYAGDVIVTSPVMTLWMTELQLLKSGRA